MAEARFLFFFGAVARILLEWLARSGYTMLATKFAALIGPLIERGRTRSKIARMSDAFAGLGISTGALAVEDSV